MLIYTQFCLQEHAYKNIEAQIGLKSKNMSRLIISVSKTVKIHWEKVLTFYTNIFYHFYWNKVWKMCKKYF